MSKLVENLKAARALIDTPEKWGKGDGLQPPSCGLLCVMNATDRATGSKDWNEEIALRDQLPNGPWMTKTLPIAAFNDHPSTTHADIMALFDRAIAAAERSVAA